MKWEEIRPGMIIKGEDDKSWLWSLVLDVRPKEVTFLTYSQIFSRLRGKGYKNSVYVEPLPKSHWTPGNEQVMTGFPYGIKRNFIKKLFSSTLEQEEV
jgi:hypothetical protein